MKSRAEFTLGLPFDEFDKERRSYFLMAVSILSGAPIEEISILSVIAGCVKIVIEIDTEALRKLVEALEPRADTPPLLEDQAKAVSVLWDHLRLQYAPSTLAATRPNDLKIRPVRKNTIFLIHGWLGGADSFADLPIYLEKSTGCICKQFIYPTGLWEYSAPLTFAARALDNWVRNELEEHSGKCAFLAHSMGGILVRDFLASQVFSRRPLDESVQQITFVASPLAGAWLAKIGKYIPLSTAKQIAEIGPNSQYLGRVTSMWNAWLPKQQHLVGNVRSILSPQDEVVDFVSAIGTDPESIPIFNSTHSNIIKPKSASDEFVRTMIRIYRESGLTEEHIATSN